MATRTRKKGQTMIYIILHIKLKIEHHESNKNVGCNSGALEHINSSPIV